jgi:CDP-diacylglycerol---glycerol-3-phosphate 3-phosphatidyltransferase
VFDGNFRTGFEKIVAPLGSILQRLGVSPDAVTATGILMAGACGYFMSQGRFFLAAVFLLLTGLPDALDGAVAKAAGTAGSRGAYLDSVSDRLSDGLLFAGAGWYFIERDSPRMVMLPFGLYIAASLVSYQRAKAESLGFEAKGGLMERAERFIALGFGLLFPSLFEAVLWLMFALTALTVITRFVKVWRQATAVRTPTEAARSRGRGGSVTKRSADGARLVGQRARERRRSRSGH